jgi:hypothetical protein
MFPWFSHLTAGIAELVRQIGGDRSVEIGVIAYSDHGHDPVLRTLDFGQSPGAVAEWIEQLPTWGGGPPSEALEDALANVSNLAWRANVPKKVLVLGDAPPHAKTECPLGIELPSGGQVVGANRDPDLSCGVW